MKGKKRILLIVCAVLTLLAVGCAAAMAVLGGTLNSQCADERWRGESETRFAQVSCFFPVGSELSEDTMLAFEQTVDQKLLDGGLEEPETGSLWTSAYSAKGTLNITGSRGSSSASVIGVGGNFFMFHPLQLRAGSYISGDDLMGDRVVLDEELAWKLFGGYDLEGMTVTIGGKPYYIAGVVARETDFASTRAYTDGAGIYMSYDALLENEGCSGISCYEFVCADPISGFAKGVVTDGLSNNGAYPVVENSNRYSLGSIFKVIGSFGERSMNTYGVVYPYWENAARLIEDYMALLLVFVIIFALIPLVCAAVFAYLAVRNGWRRTKRGAASLKDKVTERRYEKMTENSERRTRRKNAEKRAKSLKKRGKHEAKAPVDAEYEEVGQ
jgi:hypothetical protein